MLKKDTVRRYQTNKNRSECFQSAGHCVATQVPHKHGSISLEWFQWHPIFSKQYAYIDTEGLDPVNRVAGGGGETKKIDLEHPEKNARTHLDFAVKQSKIMRIVQNVNARDLQTTSHRALQSMQMI